MPGRKFKNGTSSYRYSINGQEKSDELNESLTTALFWEYDSRISRRWNVDPISKAWESPFACFGNNPILRVDVLGNRDTTVNGKYFADSKTLDGVVVRSRSLFSKKVMERIRTDAASKSIGHTYLPGELQSRIKDQINFARSSVAQSLGDMLLLSRYQRVQLTLGNRMIGLINDDENFKKFEAEAIFHLRNGASSFTSTHSVLLGGDRGHLMGLFIPLPSSGQTFRATANELTWAVRNVYITATILHKVSPSGGLIVNYSFTDHFDLVPGNRSSSYNIITSAMGKVYHGWMDNSGPEVNASWTKSY